MGLMDKVKAQATQLAQKTQETAREGRARLDQVQANKHADVLLRNLGALVFAEQTGRGTAESQGQITQLITEISAHEAENGINLQAQQPGWVPPQGGPGGAGGMGTPGGAGSMGEPGGPGAPADTGTPPGGPGTMGGQGGTAGPHQSTFPESSDPTSFPQSGGPAPFPESSDPTSYPQSGDPTPFPESSDPTSFPPETGPQPSR
jgi:hypothetical protein